MPKNSSVFTHLSVADRVTVLLGVSPNPMSRDLALMLAGIEPDQLDLAEQQAVDVLLSSDAVTSTTSSQYGPQYKLTAKAKKQRTDLDWKKLKKELDIMLFSSLFQD